MSHKSDVNQALGRRAEAAAAQYLARHGFTVIESNYHTRRGEIDIICREEDVLVFVEVKASAGGYRHQQAGRINATKQRRMTLAALDYIAKTNPAVEGMRFDALLMEAASGSRWRIEHLRDAFRPDDFDPGGMA